MLEQSLHVQLKKEYQNCMLTEYERHMASMRRMQPSSNLSVHEHEVRPRPLNGSAWYKQQAFRALNQVHGEIRALLLPAKIWLFLSISLARRLWGAASGTKMCVGQYIFVSSYLACSR